MYIELHLKLTLFLQNLHEASIFSLYIRKILKCIINKNPPVGTELFREDGRADMKKLTVAFRNFTKVPKKKLFRM